MPQTRSEFIALIKSDLFRYRGQTGKREAFAIWHKHAGFRVSSAYRVARYFELNQHPARALARWALRFSNAVHKCELRHDCRVGPGLRINHVKCMVVASGTTIGAAATLSHEVTLGLSTPTDPRSTPTLGREIYVAPGARVFGASIGSHSIIGANAVVTKDVDDRTIVSGSPARHKPLTEPQRFFVHTDFERAVHGLPPMHRC